MELTLQVFYQGIDKVSKAAENQLLSQDDQQDDPDGEVKAVVTEGANAEEGGDTTADAAEDPPKDDEDQDEDREGEAKEMTDEELAVRCRSHTLYHSHICCYFVSKSKAYIYSIVAILTY